jgi:hypothetical protein
MLKSWDRDEMYKNGDFEKLHSEMWLSLKEFEKELREEERSYKIVLKT